MPYKRTGRPPGRPKTKEYVTLSARVPQDTADQVGRYAKRHRQTLSEVMRDGFALLLQEDRYALFVSDTNSMPENVSDSITTAIDMVSDMNGVPLAPENVSDINGASESMADAIHMQRLREIVSDRNEEAPAQDIMSDTIHAATASDILSDMNGTHPIPLDTEDLDARPGAPVAISQQPALDYDLSKYVLGKLCPRGHDHNGTGQTLLTIGKRRCLPCEAAKKREKRQAAGVA